jgi:hypothetical protein
MKAPVAFAHRIDMLDAGGELLAFRNACDDRFHRIDFIREQVWNFLS